MSVSSKPHHIALDSWRGFAALLVAFHHFGSTGTLTDNAFVRNSWIFVDFFFLLSGFIIAQNYRAGLQSGGDVKRFMALRLGRLYPLHLFVLAGWFAVELAVLLFAKGGRAGFAEPHYSLASLASQLFLVQGFSTHWNSWNAASWSIAMEMWTYLLFAVVILSKPKRPEFVIAGLVVITAVMLLLHVQQPGQLGNGIFLVRCIYGFMAGALLSWAYEWMARRSAAATSFPYTWAECAASAVAITFVVVPFSPISHLLVVPAFAPVIIVFAFDRGALSRILAWSAFQRLGLLSYSIYMIHPFLQLRVMKPLAQAIQSATGLPMFSNASDGQLLWGTSDLSGNLLTLLMVVFVVVTAYVTYNWVEKPARDAVRKWLDRSAAARPGRPAVIMPSHAASCAPGPQHPQAL